MLVLLFLVRGLQHLAVVQGAQASTGLVTVALVPLEITSTEDPATIEAAVRQAVALAGGLSQVIQPGDTVVVKPNLVWDRPADSGIVTDPAVTRAVVRLAQEAGAGQVIIAEGTSMYSQDDPNRDRFCTQAAFRVAGYDTDGDMHDDVTGVPLVDLNLTGGTDVRDPSLVREVRVANGLIRTVYWLPNRIMEADVVISVPCLKNHFSAGVTLGMKNMIGVASNDIYHMPGNIYGKHELSHEGEELHRHIVDLNLARQPDFVVVDGLRGMTDGPIGSQLIQPPMRLVMAGADVVAVDTVGTLLMGYDPQSIAYLHLAAQHGLGVEDVGRIRVLGARVDQLRRDFPVPYGNPPAQRADREPPTVGFVSPAEATTLFSATTAEVTISDNVGVARVELYLDDILVGEVMAAPYAFFFDAGRFAPGPHTLLAVGFDRALNRAEAQRAVSVAPTTPTATSTSVTTYTPTITPTLVPPSPTATPTLVPSPPTATLTRMPPSPTATPTLMPPSHTVTPVPPTATHTPSPVPIPTTKPSLPTSTTTVALRDTPLSPAIPSRISSPTSTATRHPTPTVAQLPDASSARPIVAASAVLVLVTVLAAGGIFLMRRQGRVA